MVYLELFLCFLQVGCFSVGGGYAAIPLIRNQAVELYGWLTAEEFSDLVTIAEMTPGPIAVNAATFVGIRLGGISGALIATLGCILPSLIIVSILAFLYEKYRKFNAVKSVLGSLRPATVALIASAGLSILLIVLFPSDGGFALIGEKFNIVGAILSAAAFFFMRKYKSNPILIMSCCGVVYLAAGLMFE